MTNVAQRFRPITVERPKVLLPLVNVPMIEYTLEWLAMNKVEEVREQAYTRTIKALWQRACVHSDACMPPPIAPPLIARACPMRT